jgi:hypothetical protein
MNRAMTTLSLGAALAVSLSAVSWAQDGAGAKVQRPDSSTTTNNGAGLPESGALQDGTKGNTGNGGPSVEAPTGNRPSAVPGRQTTGPTNPNPGTGTVGRGNAR